VGDADAVRPSGYGSAGAPRAHERRRPSPDPLIAAMRHIADAHLHALLVISNDGGVLCANAAARRLCTHRDKMFHIRRHRLLIQGKPFSEWWHEVALPAGESTLLLRPVSAKGQRYEYAVLISRTSLRRARDPIAITVYERHRPRSITQSLLQKLYGLTRSESATAAHLFHGLRTTEVARSLGVSVHTVRSHTKRVFHKCHVKSQSELVRLLALGPGVE